MCRHSLSGNREVSWLTKAACRDWSASGRRGAEADDARPREVRLRHSSDEVAGQNQGTGSGGDGAKGGGRGEREPAKHAPGAGPGKRVTGAGARTASRKAKEEGAVHRALPPHQLRNATYRVLRAEAGRGCGRRRGDVAGLRSRSRSQDRRFERSGPSGSLSGAALAASVHSEARWAAASAGSRRP